MGFARVVLAGIVVLASSACTQVRVSRAQPVSDELAAGGTASSGGDVDGWGAMPQLLQAVNQARHARGAPPLRVDRGLALVAQDAGADYQRLGRGSEQRVARRANAELRSLSLVFGRVAAVVVFVEELEQAVSVLGPALDPQMRCVGMSVAQSAGTTRAQDGYAVVVTLGR